MKPLPLSFFLLTLSAFAQTPIIPVLVPTIPTTVPVSAPDPDLPSMTVGVGPSWTRGDVHAITADVDVAKRLGDYNAFWWTTISTPVATVAPGASPLASTITTGGAWVAARNPTGSVSLVLLALGGLSQTSGSITPAFTGSAGVAFRLGKSNVYLMPYAMASNPTRGANGSLISTILQPGFRLIYGFGSK